MSNSYGEVFTSTTEELDKKYRPFNNLFLLKGLKEKVKCYSSFSQDPFLYYECFNKIEMNMVQQSQEFGKDCELIDVSDGIFRINLKSVFQIAVIVILEHWRKSKNAKICVEKNLRVQSISSMINFI